MDVKTIITKLGLQPHPEGGYFKEIYRSHELVSSDALPERYSGSRCFGTSIYFLLSEKQFSTFHRIKSDEIWNYHLGSSLFIHIIYPDGNYERIKLGADVVNNEVPQYIVKQGCWFGAELTDKNSYTLVGCSVAPGFDFADFEMAQRDKLISKFPQHKDIITQLTH